MPHFKSGLVSVTFRSLSVPDIIDLAVEARLDVLEWGGDIHVPAGDIAHARDVRRWTEDAGLYCAAYGSYYRLGQGEATGTAFEPIVETAVALGAPTIRVWTGTKGSDETTAVERKAIVEDARRCADLAWARGVTVSLEYHGGTLTDRRESVRSLMEEVSAPGLEFLWQPTNEAPEEECVERLIEVLPRLRHVHVFHWWPSAADRRPLVEGEACWKQYLQVLRKKGTPVPCLLEFVRDDSPEQFLQDAATLRRWLAELE